MYYVLKMEIVHIYVSPQRRPQATGHEIPFFAFFGFGVGGMLTSLWTCSRHVCFVNFGFAWVIYIYIYIYTILHNENHI